MKKHIETEKEVGLRDVYRFSAHCWSKRKWHLALVVGFITATVVVDVLVPYFGGRLIDSLAQEKQASQLEQAFLMLGVFVGLFFLFNFFRTMCDLLWSDYSVRVLRTILNDAFHKVQRLSTNWHNNEFAGATVRKITRGMWGFDIFGDTLIVGIYPSLLIMFGVTFSVGIHWPIMGGMLFLFSLCLIGVAVFLNMKYLAPANQLANALDSKVSATLADAITCNAVVKSFGTEEREDERFKAVSHEWSVKARRSWFLSVVNHAAQRLMVMVMMGSMLGVAIMMWYKGLATPGQVTFVMSSCFMVAGYLRDMGMHLRNIQRAINDMEDIIIFRDMNLDIDDAADAGDLDVPRGEIAFQNVNFAYPGQERDVYKNFSLVIKPGEKVGLVGHSGSGKSTFVKLLQRLHDIQGGEILIDGQNIARVTQESLRQNVALVPQEPTLFHRSLSENIAYARPSASQAEIIEAARKAHADEFIRELPEGYDTLVGERGVKLSGGERQRVAIARAFLANAPILVLDEATSSLDSMSEALIQDALEHLMKGRTTLVIAHRLSTIQDVDRILVFHKGRIVEQGTHGELVAHSHGYYANLYRMQVEGFDTNKHLEPFAADSRQREEALS